jgi:hypothetical protein
MFCDSLHLGGLERTSRQAGNATVQHCNRVQIRAESSQHYCKSHPRFAIKSQSAVLLFNSAGGFEKFHQVESLWLLQNEKVLLYSFSITRVYSDGRARSPERIAPNCSRKFLELLQFGNSVR